ncbi:entry exclusion protein TrbK [Rhizobium rhizogenes]|uniref:entry exclusion protein TrbK n=1 Tax=Rhizobium rhizogenes TaxID=359 RepID=UPI001571EF16|nr:entry exclusion protein TrbK [Rhizobium rhizogenes]
MSRLTITVLVVGTIGITAAATCWFVAPTSETGVVSRDEQRRHRERFFKATPEKPLVGQEMRPRW